MAGQSSKPSSSFYLFPILKSSLRKCRDSSKVRQAAQANKDLEQQQEVRREAMLVTSTRLPLLLKIQMKKMETILERRQLLISVREARKA